jgi:AraC-like DNA-binding protein
VLVILQPHTGGRLPSLVDRYLQLRSDQPDALVRFRKCVEGVILYRGIGNIHVEHAVAIVHASYGEADLRQAGVADTVGLTPGGLCAAFRAHIGLSFVEYLRGVRLDHAAALLTGSSCSVKSLLKNPSV